MKILLFDMDGVLLQSLGYHRALQETVRLVGRAIGYQNAGLTDEHIAAFESNGVTCEWYSGAMYTAYLHMLARDQDPQALYPENLDSWPRIINSDNVSPDPLFSILEGIPVASQTQLNRVVEGIGQATKNRTPNQEYKAIVEESEDLDKSLTMRIFQELVLGSQQYEQTYNRRSELNTPSYLSQFDIPLLKDDTRRQLFAWLQETGNSAAILTNRPSRQIPDAPSTPEAEIGRALAGLDEMPVIGLGETGWLGKRKGVDSAGLNKPSPLHTLAAMQAAVGECPEDSLERAYTFLNSEPNPEAWSLFNNAEVLIFEDTIAGLISLQRAQETLAAHGISFKTKKYGISPNKTKQAALSTQGASIFDSINPALEDALS